MRFAALFAIFCAFSCGKCGSAGKIASNRDAGTTIGAVRGGTLTVRAMTEPATLNFLEGTSRETWTARLTHNLVVESLLDIDAKTFALKPALASSWSERDEHHITTLTLRGDVKFHDGAAFTARDAIAVLDAVKDPRRNTSSIRADFEELSSWKMIDEHTIELQWRNPSPFALRSLAKLPMLPASALAGDWAALAEKPIGTGPYRIEAWQRGQRLVLKRIDDRAFIDTLVFRFVKDHTIATGLFERGELDVLTNVQPVIFKTLEGDFERLRGIDNSFSYIAWNEAVPMLADARVRRALAHVYPAGSMAKSVDLGLEAPTTCPYWALGPSCDPGVKPFLFSAEEARAQLVDAGFAPNAGGLLSRAGQPLRLHLLIPASSVRLAKLSPMLQEEFRRAGGELVIETVDVSAMGARVAARDFEMVSRVLTELDGVQDLYGTFHSSQIDGGANLAGYSSPGADRLLEAIRTEWSDPKRQELERALHRHLFEDQPYLFMTSRSSLDLARRRVHGLVPSPLWYDLRSVWVSP